MDKLGIFKEELALINSPDLKKLAERLILNADYYFFIASASPSGNYHPPFDRGLGGLVRHSKVVVTVTNWLCKARNIEGRNKELLIIAALAHDIKKFGKGKKLITISDHPERAAEYVVKTNNTLEQKLQNKELKIICRCIVTHMGQWGNIFPKSKYEYLIHSADYIASRQQWEAFNFETYYIPTKEDVGNFLMCSGKYVGKCLKDIDKEYMIHLIEDPTYKDKELKCILSYYLDIPFNSN